MVGDLSNIAIHVLLFISLFFEVFLLVSFFEKRRTVPQPPETPKRFLSATIIVPCYNEELTVVKTINSLLGMDYPKDKLMVFAVDDGSKDGTWQVLQQFADHPQVRIFHKENGGKHTALNFGLTHVTTDLVGCLDADSFVDPNALTAVVRRFQDESVMAVTPAIKVWKPVSTMQYIQQAEYAVSAFIRRTFSWLNSIFITPGPFSIFRRSVFEALGPYKEAHQTEDMEIALRMQVHHMRIENAPDAHVYTNAPRTYKALFKQRVRWTYGFLKNSQDYRYVFFNPRYGDLGMFLLPIGLFTVFPAMYFTALFIFSGLQYLIESYTRIRLVGIQSPQWSIDWFFLNTHSIVFLTIVLIAVMVGILVIGKRLMDEEKIWTKDMALYLFLYGFLAPWWLMRAVYNVTTSRQKSWAKEIDERRRDNA